MNTMIFEDDYGLYTINNGCLVRPFFGTKFKKDDVVKTQYLEKEKVVGVTIPGKKGYGFNDDELYEIWYPTKTLNFENIQKLSTSNKVIVKITKDYRRYTKHLNELYGEINEKFII